MQARTVWLDWVIRPVSIHSGKSNTQLVTNENLRKTELTNEKQRKTPDQ